MAGLSWYILVRSHRLGYQGEGEGKDMATQLIYYDKQSLNEAVANYQDKGYVVSWKLSGTTDNPSWTLTLKSRGEEVQEARGRRPISEVLAEAQVAGARKGQVAATRQQAYKKSYAEQRRELTKGESGWRKETKETGRLGGVRETTALKGARGLSSRFAGTHRTGMSVMPSAPKITESVGGMARIAQAPGQPNYVAEEPRQGSGLGLSRQPGISRQTGGGSRAPSSDLSLLRRTSYIKSPEEMRGTQ